MRVDELAVLFVNGFDGLQSLLVVAVATDKTVDMASLREFGMVSEGELPLCLQLG